MLDNHGNRNLSDVFKELQIMQEQPNYSEGNTNTSVDNFFNQKQQKANNDTNFTIYKNSDLKLSHIIIGCTILVIGLAAFFPRVNSSTHSYAVYEDDDIEAISEYELNRHRLNMQNIISENSEIDRVKEQVTEEREVEFETQYNNNPSLIHTSP